MNRIIKSKFFKRVLLISLIFFIALFLLAATTYFLLPTIISSEKFKHFVEAKVSFTLQKQVNIGKITYTLPCTTVIENISVKNNTLSTDSHITSIKKIDCVFRLRKLIKKCINFDLNIKGVDAFYIREKPEKKLNGGNKTTIRENQPADFKKYLNNFAIALPFDLQTKIRMDEISFHFIDNVEKNKFDLSRAFFHLDMPSFYKKPVNLSFRSDLYANEKKLSWASLNILIKKLFDKNRSLNLNNPYMKISGTFPGTDISIKTDLPKSLLSGEIGVDLLPISKILTPFLEKNRSDTNVKGKVKFFFNAFADSLKIISFNSKLVAKGLVINDMSEKNRSAGPFHLNFMQNGTFDIVKGTIYIKKSTFGLCEKSHMNAKATIKGLYKDNQQVDFLLESLFVDVNELYVKSEKIIPDDIFPLIDNNIFSSTIKAESINCFSDMEKGLLKAKFKNFTFNVPKFCITIQKKETSDTDKYLISNSSFTLKSIETRLKNSFPNFFNVVAGLKIKNIKASSKASPLYVNGIDLKEINIKSDNLIKSSQNSDQVSGTFNIYNSLKINNITIPSNISLKDINQSGSYICILPSENRSENSMQAALKNFTINVSPLILKDQKKDQIFNTNCKLNAEIDKIVFDMTDFSKSDIYNLQADIYLDEMLSANIKADLKDMGFTSVKSNVQLSANLKNNSKKAKKNAFLFNDILQATGGEIACKINFDGRMLNTSEFNAFSSSNSLPKKSLDFLNKVSIALTMNNINAKYVTSADNQIYVKNLSTLSPFFYTFDQKNKKGKFKGKILSKADFLPLNTLKKPLNIEIDISGEHDLLKSLILTSSIKVLPLNLKGKMDINVLDIDKIIKQDFSDSLPKILNSVAGNLLVSLGFDDRLELNVLTDDIDIKGSFKTRTSMKFIPDQKININCSAIAKDLNVNVIDTLKVKNLQANCKLKKQYSYFTKSNSNKKPKEKLKKRSKEKPKEKRAPLAFKVFGKIQNFLQAVQVKAPAPDKNAFRNTIKRRYKSKYDLSCPLSVINFLDLPLNIKNIVCDDINLENGLPKADYFQFNMLGGTVVGTFSTLKKNSSFFISLNMEFSEIDTGMFFPDGKKDKTSTIGGYVKILFPLLTNLSSVCQNTDVQILLSPIGSRALEKLLYAIDPLGNNKTILLQRLLLQKGSPSSINLAIKDGSFSLNGKITVKNYLIDIPPLEMFSIANFPGLREYEKHLVSLKPLIEILTILSAESVEEL